MVYHQRRETTSNETFIFGGGKFSGVGITVKQKFYFEFRLSLKHDEAKKKALHFEGVCHPESFFAGRLNQRTSEALWFYQLEIKYYINV